LPIGAAPGSYPGRRTLLVVILAAGVICATASGAAASGSEQTSALQTRDAAAADFVGSAACVNCHEEVIKGFASNPHSKLAAAHGKTEVTCEGCHGAGRAHVQAGGDKTRIFSFAAASAREVDDRCLSCHQDEHPGFERTSHGEGNVSCVGCHSIHAGEDKEHLLKAVQPNLCFECHSDVKPDFSMPYRHKVNEGRMQCSDCHDPHGALEKKSLRTSTQQAAVCTRCHTETAGPFVYEHNVIKAEGCTACHAPHGSPNPRLLNRASVNAICLQCHAPSINAAGSGLRTFHMQGAQAQACTNCHIAIHGSNTSSFFIKSTG
jgi:DmsE family decaheme c-type cytochrome